LPSLSYGQGGDDPPADPTTSLSPAAQDLKFEHLTAEQGLSNNRVLSILKDSTGFMWFGTFDGLNRFDGYKFKVFRHDPGDENSLSANVIEVVYEDQSGSLWIGTSGGGLNRFDPKTERFTHYRHDPDDPRSLGSDTVLAIHQSRDGALWIGTGGGGLNLYDPESDGFARYQHDPDNPHSLSGNAVRAIFEDSQGVLWIGTDSNGLNRFDRDASEGGTFTTYRQNPDDPHSLGHDSVAVIHEDRTGDLWIGFWGGGLDRLDRERAGGQVARFTHYRHDPEHPGSLSHNVVSSLYEDPAGRLWVGTAGGGLNRLDRQTGHFYQFQSNPDDPHSLSHDFVRTMYGDPTGLLWVGSTGGGISILDFERKAFAHYRNISGDPNSLNSNDVMGIYVDPEGALWVGTGSGGLNRFDRQRFQVNHYVHDPEDPHSLSHNMVREIVQDARGNLWLATAGGLNRFDPQGGRFTAYRQDPADPSGLLSDNVLTIHTGRSGLFWVGTWFGLNRVDPLGDEIVNFQNEPDDSNGLSGEALVSIYEDQAGVLWLGTFGAGLIRFEPQTERTARYQHDVDDPHSLADNTVFAIHQASVGNLWLGTSAGLDRFDPDAEQFIHYGEKDGLPAASVASILEDDLPPEQGGPNLWISTSKGLSRFNPQTGAVRNYDVSDGLQGNDFVWGSAFKSKDGELFFGGTNGLTAFYPSQIVDNPHIPPVVITDFQLANRPVEIAEDSVLKQSVGQTEQLTLSYQDRVISFEFAALNYRAPGNNLYRYKLEGFDEEWTETGSDRRFVTYTNLNPGEYVFRVIGSNNDGVWSEEGASIKITVTPPWWGTWWFRGGLVLLLVALVAGGFGWQRANARWRERYLEARLAEQTGKLDERVKELECLYSISTLAAQTDISLDEVLQGTVALLPPAWQHPEIACARLEVDGQEYTTENYQASDWRQSADIMVHGERAGEVEVRYLEPRLDADEGPFIT
jgi:ligand-binding sensor domain-containing protein